MEPRDVFQAGVLSLLIWAGVAAAAEGPVIECTARMGKADLRVTLDAQELTVILPQKPALKYKIKGKEVTGAGVHARDIYLLERGEFSFLDTYGCLSKEVLHLDDLGRISSLSCHRLGTPACPK